MYSEDDLNAAVQARVLSREAADAFRAYVASRHRASGADDEHVRLITGFNDVFVVIAGALLLVAVYLIAAAGSSWFGWLAVSAASWLLAEHFVRRRRMALPSIVLLGVFVAAVFATGLALAGASAPGLALASAMAVAAAGAHWLRFRVPITIAAGAAAAICFALAALIWLQPDLVRWLNVLFLGAGALVFALALRWDASDPARRTRRSDVAFWLHLLAAPLLVHPVFSMLQVLDGDVGILQALVVLALYLVIGLVSVCIDRRALMVSALGYVLVVFSSLIDRLGEPLGAVSLGFALTALIIGSALLLLSAFWQTARAAAVGRLPEQLTGRLPPLR